MPTNQQPDQGSRLAARFLRALHGKLVNKKPSHPSCMTTRPILTLFPASRRLLEVRYLLSYDSTHTLPALAGTRPHLRASEIHLAAKRRVPEVQRQDITSRSVAI